MIPWAEGRLSVPMFAVEGKNHTSLLIEPDDALADQIISFLEVDSAERFQTWVAGATNWSASALAKMKQDKQGSHDGWQQFVIHVTDEYGEPVPDYVVDLYRQDPTGLEGDDLNAAEIQDFDLHVHAYSTDQSFRCFHVRIPQGAAANGAGRLWMSLNASTGTKLIAYQGYSPNSKTITEQSPVVLELSAMNSGADRLFCPFTTTLVEVKLTREPLPFKGQTQVMRVGVYQP